MSNGAVSSELAVDTYFRSIVLQFGRTTHPTVDELGRVVEYSVRVVTSPCGSSDLEELVQVDDWDQLTDWQRRLSNRDLDPRELNRYAGRLGELMMPQRAREFFWESIRTFKQSNDGLRIVLHIIPELDSIPWEYAAVSREPGPCDRQDLLLLRLDRHISIIRRRDVATGVKSFRPGLVHRLAVVLASPPGQRGLELAKEQEVIEQALHGHLSTVAHFVPDYGTNTADNARRLRFGASEEDLRNLANEAIDIFHFSGHGGFTEDHGPLLGTTAGEGYVIVSDGRKEQQLQGDELARILAPAEVRLAVLSACKSAKRDLFGPWSSVAASLLKSGVPAVIAMQFSIYDHAAIIFASRLYPLLADGVSIDEAVWQARMAVASDTRCGRDWGVPVLYLRNEGGPVLGVVEDPEARAQARSLAQQTVEVNRTFVQWSQHQLPASPQQLDLLERAGAGLLVGVPDLVILLRSAIQWRKATAHWVDMLRSKGEGLIDGAVQQSSDAADDPALYPELIGVKGLPTTGKKLAQAAVSALADWRLPEAVLRAKTAALVLYALAPEHSLELTANALDSFQSGNWQRRKSRAVLYGTIAENDANAARVIRRRTNGIEDRLAIWAWRLSLCWRRQAAAFWRILIGGAVGAALALASLRVLQILAFSPGLSGPRWATNSYWGFMLGLAVVFGVLAAPVLMLLPIQGSHALADWRVQIPAIVLGGMCFGLMNALVGLFNLMRPREALNTVPVAVLVGAALAFGIVGQSWSAQRVNWSSWIGRGLVVGFLFALSQLPVFCQFLPEEGQARISPCLNRLYPEKVVNHATGRESDRPLWMGIAVFLNTRQIFGEYSESRVFAAAPEDPNPLQAAYDACNTEELMRCCMDCPAPPELDQLALGATSVCTEELVSVVDAAVVGVVLLAGIVSGMRQAGRRVAKS